MGISFNEEDSIGIIIAFQNKGRVDRTFGHIYRKSG